MILTPIDRLYENDELKPVTSKSDSIKARIAEWNSTHKSKMSLNKNGSIDMTISWFNFLRGRL